MASAESGRGRHIEDPPGGTQEDGTGGKYRAGRTDTEQRPSKIVKWSGEETE